MKQLWWLWPLGFGHLIDLLLTLQVDVQHEGNPIAAWFWAELGPWGLVVLKVGGLLGVVLACRYLHKLKPPIRKFAVAAFHIEIAIMVVMQFGVCLWNADVLKSLGA